jgi:hypothetical protein
MDSAGSPGPRHPAGLLFRHVVQARLEDLLRHGDRVLQLGGGTGADALLPASRAVRVVRIEGVEGLAAAGTEFDGAYSVSGALDAADLRVVGAALALALRPGAPVVLGLRGPWPLPAVLRRVLTGVGDPRRPRSARANGGPPAWGPPTIAEARAALGPGLVWTGAFALGVLVPGPEQERWVSDHPQGFALLAALERVVRRWPGLRQLGDQVVLEGRRRPA